MMSTHLKLPSRLRLHFPLKKLQPAQPAILEPMMLCTITVPEESDVITQLLCRGRDGMEAHGNSQTVFVLMFQFG